MAASRRPPKRSRRSRWRPASAASSIRTTPSSASSPVPAASTPPTGRQMLARMYLRWAESKDFSTQIVDESPAEEAGLKSITFFVRGRNAYGLLESERGVHRLVRLSPFDAAHRRHTSFAAVDVIPEVQAGEEFRCRDKTRRPARRDVQVRRRRRPICEQDRIGSARGPSARPGSSSRRSKSARKRRTATSR